MPSAMRSVAIFQKSDRHLFLDGISSDPRRSSSRSDRHLFSLVGPDKLSNGSSYNMMHLLFLFVLAMAHLQLFTLHELLAIATKNILSIMLYKFSSESL